jgi:hypothetical protein
MLVFKAPSRSQRSAHLSMHPGAVHDHALAAALWHCRLSCRQPQHRHTARRATPQRTAVAVRTELSKSASFFHPDYTVGTGFSPVRAIQARLPHPAAHWPRSRPRRLSRSWTSLSRHHRSGIGERSTRFASPCPEGYSPMQLSYFHHKTSAYRAQQELVRARFSKQHFACSSPSSIACQRHALNPFSSSDFRFAVAPVLPVDSLRQATSGDS